MPLAECSYPGSIRYADGCIRGGLCQAASNTYVSLSGGGHRAALFGAGALLYLIDADKGADLSCVASVSGGSITNAAVGLSSDLRTTDATAFRERLRPLIQACTTKGTVWSAPLTIGYLAFGVLVLAIATYLCFPLSG